MPVGAVTACGRCNEVPWSAHCSHSHSSISIPHTSHTLILLLPSNTQTSYLKLKSIYTHFLSNPQRDLRQTLFVPFYRWENWGKSINGLSNAAKKSPSKSFHFNIVGVNWLYLRYQNHGNKKPYFRILSLHYYFYFHRLQIRYLSSFCFIPRRKRFQVKHEIKKWW